MPDGPIFAKASTLAEATVDKSPDRQLMGKLINRVQEPEYPSLANMSLKTVP